MKKIYHLILLNVFDSSVNQSLPKMFIDSNFKTVDYNEGSGLLILKPENK